MFIWSLWLLYNNGMHREVPQEVYYQVLKRNPWDRPYFFIRNSLKVAKSLKIGKKPKWRCIYLKPIPRVSFQNLSLNIQRYPPLHTIVIQKWQASEKYIFILVLSISNNFVISKVFLMKSWAYPTCFSSELDSKYYVVPPPYAHQFYTNVASFR